MKLFKLILLLLLLTGLALPVVAQDDEPALPDEIIFEAPAGLQPEGIVWDEAGERFLVGSLLDGTIGAVDDEGVYTPLFTDLEFTSSVGLHIADGKLYIANGALSAFTGGNGFAGLTVYDLETEELVYAVDLTKTFEGTGARFSNDVTVDPDGNAYVTDSRQPVIYKVTPEGEASVLVESPLLAAGIGGNGIDYHPDNYLLVAVAGSLKLLRVPLNAPEELTAVEWDTLSAIDGMVLSEDGTTLYAVAGINGGISSAAIYTSEDDWQTATLASSVRVNRAATTLALRDGEAYVINAYVQNRRQTTYEIIRAVFE